MEVEEDPGEVADEESGDDPDKDHGHLVLCLPPLGVGRLVGAAAAAASAVVVGATVGAGVDAVGRRGAGGVVVVAAAATRGGGRHGGSGRGSGKEAKREII